MDELVERCKAALQGGPNVEFDRGFYAPKLTPDELSSIIRAIIPIVADWQRERDAGIAELHDHRGDIATAIRGAE